MAILNDSGCGHYAREVIEQLVTESKHSVKPLTMRAGTLSNNPEELRLILSDFPRKLNITRSTTVNGLAAFEALYFSLGENLQKEILSHNKGPLGPSGYAAIATIDGILGKGNSREHFINASLELLRFTKEFLEKALENY